jgi:Tol biopolymer transport system component
MNFRRLALWLLVVLYPAAWGPPAIAQTTGRVSESSAGQEANGPSGVPSISADGRFVAFESDASNLVPNDTNGRTDIFVHDRVSLTTARVSVSSDRAQGNDESRTPRLSANGRFVAFESRAGNLVSDDTNGVLDVFVHDRLTGETTRASVSSAGAEGDAASARPAISADGRYVAFDSDATTLAPGGAHSAGDIFVHDRWTGETVRVSVSSSGTPSNGPNSQAAISADGRFVAFTSSATNLIVPDLNGDFTDVFVRDRATGQTSLASRSTNGVQGDLFSFEPAISADGRWIAFTSIATNLVEPPVTGPAHVFAHDRLTGETLLVTANSNGEEGNRSSRRPRVSMGGRYVAFDTLATNLTSGDTNGMADVCVRDLVTGEIVRLSLSWSDGEGNASSRRAAISGDTTFVAFESLASNLTDRDGNETMDVMLRDRRPCRAGSVNATFGPVEDVLFVNSSSGAANHRTVDVGIGAPVTVALRTGSSGPSPARYVLWGWRVPPVRQLELRALGETLGCTANPTPLTRSIAPQPIACLLGSGIPEIGCRGVRTLPSPSPHAPWLVERGRGFLNPVTLTLQGILGDSGAANATGFSVTNAVTIVVR